MDSEYKMNKISTYSKKEAYEDSIKRKVAKIRGGIIITHTHFYIVSVVTSMTQSLYM